ncbi:FAD-dependent oxidoreductase [Alloyangia pacifica]|uniref:Dehydrogenase (Flavoprotein) n=1 Tax=Alloyangia pacifica TaxID=311180 RepID=A0A1I6VXY3_9RHOB|nr:NAD(P)/FAD-dependent oxidoreductase [Alloyangia pacifica]SDI19452.1 Dehydrogenase (flavoprotein) [Alloyangia pacifica]SFT18566.1 Dehydrogenase (flavoprotein) [Alloyangia pacifica]
MTKETYDALIVGARCAGAATALQLARSGAKVLLIDSARAGSDTMSTHALMRGAVMLLERWGLAAPLRAAGTPLIARTSFIYGPEVFDIDLRPEHGVEALMAPRRFLLDRMLAEAAAEAGAELRFETSCTGLIQDAQGRVVGARLAFPDGGIREVSAGLVIGADGKRSRVARLVGAEGTRQAQHTVACAYQYVSGLPNRGFRWHFAEGAAGGIIPTNDGASCAFVALPERAAAELRSAPLQELAARHMPVMAEDMAGAEPVEARVIFAGLKGYMRRCAGPGWALVGDASWFRDPITAHGITDAFRDSELLVEAVKTGTLGRYEAQRDHLSLPIFDLSDRIASFDWSLGDLAGLHKQLNRAMKANQGWIAGARDEVRRVA